MYINNIYKNYIYNMNPIFQYFAYPGLQDLEGLESLMILKHCITHCIQTETDVVVSKARKLVKQNMPFTILTDYDLKHSLTHLGCHVTKTAFYISLCNIKQH